MEGTSGILKGIAASPGIKAGKAVLINRPHTVIENEQDGCEDPNAEIKRLKTRLIYQDNNC